MLNRAVGPLGELANRARSPAIPVAGHLDYRVGRDALRTPTVATRDGRIRTTPEPCASVCRLEVPGAIRLFGSDDVHHGVDRCSRRFSDRRGGGSGCGYVNHRRCAGVPSNVIRVPRPSFTAPTTAYMNSRDVEYWGAVKNRVMSPNRHLFTQFRTSTVADRFARLIGLACQPMRR